MTSLYSNRDGYFSFAVAVFVYLVAQLVFGSLLPLAEPQSVGYCIIYACVSLALFAIAFGYAKMSSKKFFVATSGNVAPKWAHVLWGCLATLGLIHFSLPVNEWFLDFFEWCGLERPDVEFSLPLAGLIVTTVICAPIAEEFLFRGTVGQGLVCSKKPLEGILLSGALFALFHLNAAQTLHQFVLGSMLMLFVWRSASVWTGVIIHAFNNLVAVVLTYTVEPTGFYQKYPLCLFVVGFVVFAGAIVGYLFTTKNHAKTPTDEQMEKPNSSVWAIFGLAVAVCVALWIANLFVE